MEEFDPKEPFSEAPQEVFERVCSAWSLSEEERLKLFEIASQYDGIEGLLHIEKIYQALHIVFSEAPERADGWVHRPNKHFDGNPAVKVMLNDSEGLLRVRQYLMSHVM